VLCFHIYGILFPIHDIRDRGVLHNSRHDHAAIESLCTTTVWDGQPANAACHDLHHARAPTNVSVVLTVCDRLFGTYQKA
jgi:sterol desaturase/sphingolipid hydroxylase (fatty acid hydroxylase superfamily)